MHVALGNRVRDSGSRPW